jgi:septal ring factor EnvC (AmiA/AmiB activator)
VPVSYGCKARRLREAPLPLSLDAGESRLYADQQRCDAAAAAAQAAERERNAAAAQEDPEVAEQARKLAEMMKVAEASGLVRSTHLAYSNQKPKWP